MENQRNQNSEDNNQNNKEKKHSSAASIDSIISGATGNVQNRRHTDTLSNTGTNVSCDGPTAPAGGGSVGTGYASGQDATGARIATGAGDDIVGRTNNDDDQSADSKGEDLMKPEDRDDDLDRNTMGTP